MKEQTYRCVLPQDYSEFVFLIEMRNSRTNVNYYGVFVLI